MVRPDAAPEDDTGSTPATATHKPYWYEDMEIWGGTVMSTENPLGTADGPTAQARVKNASGEIVASMFVIKGATNAIPIPVVEHDGTEDSGSSPIYAPNIGGWCHGLRFGAIGNWVDFIASLISLSPSLAELSNCIFMRTTSIKMYNAGSDTQVSMFRYPIYVMGVVDPDVPSFKVSVSGTQPEETKSTWFYRPARKKATDHGWI